MAMQVSELTPVPTEPVDTRFRRIATPIPVPDSIPAIERLRTAEPRSMAGLPPVIWQRARGFQVEDPYGNRFIDLTSGAAAANAGHAHPRIVKAVHEQLDRRAPLHVRISFGCPLTPHRAGGRPAAARARQGDRLLLRDRGQRVRADPDAPARAVDLARQGRHPVVQRHLLRPHAGVPFRRRAAGRDRRDRARAGLPDPASHARKPGVARIPRRPGRAWGWTRPRPPASSSSRSRA